MLHTKEVSIALDLSNMDEVILKYTKKLAYQLNMEKVNFIHIIPTMLSPDNKDVPMKQALGFDFDLGKRVFDHIQTTTQKVFSNGMETAINVLEGNPFQLLLNEADDSDADLLVVGKKNKSGLSGINLPKVVRQFKGFVLFVPEDVSMKINNISVPMDFSEYSARALRAALGIANRLENCKVRAVHALNGIPENYYTNFKTKNDIRNQMLMNAEQAWNFFIANNGFDENEVPIDYTGEITATHSSILNDYFIANETDMVVMGAKGHTSFEKFLYGSVTEGLVDT